MCINLLEISRFLSHLSLQTNYIASSSVSTLNFSISIIIHSPLHIMDERLKLTVSSKKKRKRGGKNRESRFEKKKIRSITVHVSVGIAIPGVSPLVLDGFTSSDTIGVVKARFYQKAKELGLRPLRPEIGSLRLPQGHRLEDKQTLASLSAVGCSHLPISIVYLESAVSDIDAETKEKLQWLLLCKRVRFKEEAHEKYSVSWGFEEDDSSNREPVCISKRPKTIHEPLPFVVSSDLHIHGSYQLLDCSNNNNRSSSVPAFQFAASVHDLKTTASVILLAPSDEIFEELVSLNSDFQYLVVRVCWDKVSYFLLRNVGTLYPDIPIVAVTDLDPHHLDLLTFLDTPHDYMHICYGWDFTRDLHEAKYACDTDFVNIKWLGLRDTDCKDVFHFDDVVSSRPPPRPGFQEVIRMLRVNPFLRRKRNWLAALDWLDVFGRSVALAPAYLGNDFIAKKVLEKDWV